MKNKISIISILTISTMLFSACYSSRPAANKTSSPDYNKRVNVSGAHNVKRSNALNVTFQVGLIGAGTYGGYNMDLIKHQTENGREPVRAANAAVGALAGAGLGFLFDYVAGKNTKNYNVDPQKWVWKANKEYRLLDKSYSRDFRIIHPSAEKAYTVKNIQDVRDFQTIFPNSSYTDNTFQQAIKHLDRNDLPELITLYPTNQYVEMAKVAYIKNSPSFDAALAAAQKYPLKNADELCVTLIQSTKNAVDFIKKFPATTYKKTAVINAFNAIAPTKLEMQNLNDVYGDIIYLNSTDLNSEKDIVRNHYYLGIYNLIIPASSAQFDKFNADYSWLTYTNKSRDLLSTFWNMNERLYSQGKDVIYNFKSILANPLYANYKITEAEVKQFMTDKFKEEVSKNVKILNENVIGQNNPEWENWKNSPYTAGMVHEEGKVNYILYGEIRNYSKYDLPVVLGGGAILQQVMSIKGQGLGSLLTGLAALTGQSTTQARDVAIAQDYYYFPVIPAGEKVIYSLLLDFGTQIKNTGVNIFDMLKGSNELVLRDTKVEIRYNTEQPSRAQLEKQNGWQRLAKDGGLPAGKLTDFMRGEEVRQDIWTVRYEDYKERMQEAMRNASYSSSSESLSRNDDNISEEDIDPDKVSIPKYEITTNWTNRATLSISPGHQYLEAKFTDGTKIEISRYDSDKVPFVKKCVPACWDMGEYKTDDYAIKAAYVWEKYSKLRTIGKK